MEPIDARVVSTAGSLFHGICHRHHHIRRGGGGHADSCTTEAECSQGKEDWIDPHLPPRPLYYAVLYSAIPSN